MRTLVIGTGGREHALAWALSREPGAEVHAAPGNPGIARIATLHEVDPLDGDTVAELAAAIDADLVVIGPEAPLVAGVADAVRERGIACFGPSAAAARLEGSKAFAKEVMAAAGVPTAGARVCVSAEEVAAALEEFGAPYVVKDDGLAAGKGVIVTRDRDEALAHAGGCERVVVEEFLDGPEFSLFAVCDGEDAYALQPSQDFKRIRDGGRGPNTGGMGAYSPLPWLPDGLADLVLAEIVRPTLAEMAGRGTPYRGALYVGLALTDAGPKVIEFNCRFGDPDIQPVLALLDTPLAPLLHAAATGSLAEVAAPEFGDRAAVSVVLASAGYPESSTAGEVIVGVETVEADHDDLRVIHAGTELSVDGLVTAGGRVLAVLATGDTVADARARAYEGVHMVSFAGAQYRRDIAAEPLGVVEGAASRSH